MKARMLLFRFSALLLAAASVLNGFTGIACGYEYVCTPTYHESVNPAESYYYRDGTRWEEEAVTAHADNGYLSCMGHAFAQAQNGDTASASAMGWPTANYEWQWDGPPGTAPGGSLSWYHAGHGGAKARGVNWNLGGNTTATASSYALAGNAITSPNDESVSVGEAQGTVTNDEGASGGQSLTTDGEVEWYNWYEDPNPDAFLFDTGDWETYYEPDDPEAIPSGTAYFYFYAEAICYCDAEASVSGVGTSEAEVDSWSAIYYYLDFEPN